MAPSRQQEEGSPVVFITSVTFIQIFGLGAVIMTGIWMGKYQGGFAWDGSHLEFNYHPLCMVISMVYLYSEAMIIYRVFRHENKFQVKLVHFILQLIAFCVAVVGLKAVWDFHNHSGFPNMYSLHSWLGLSTVLLFACQLAGGFISFLFPKLSDTKRASYLGVHVFFGVFIFIMAIVTCLTGITEKAMFSVPTYSQFIPEGILLNCIGMFLLALAFVTLYVMSNPAYKRQDNVPEQVALIRESDPMK